MRYVPEVERTEWHEKAIAAAGSADLHSHMQLLLETREIARLAALVRTTADEALEGVSHFATETGGSRPSSFRDASVRTKTGDLAAEAVGRGDGARARELITLAARTADLL